MFLWTKASFFFFFFFFFFFAYRLQSLPTLLSIFFVFPMGLYFVVMFGAISEDKSIKPGLKRSPPTNRSAADRSNAFLFFFFFLLEILFVLTSIKCCRVLPFLANYKWSAAIGGLCSVTVVFPQYLHIYFCCEVHTLMLTMWDHNHWDFIRFIIIQSTLVITNSKGLSEILRDIRTSTYQICRIYEKMNRTAAFNKYICNLTPEVRDILKILWKRGVGAISPLFHNILLPDVRFSCLSRDQIIASR